MMIFLSVPSTARKFFYWTNVLTTVHVNPTIRESTEKTLLNLDNSKVQNNSFKQCVTLLPKIKNKNFKIHSYRWMSVTRRLVCGAACIQCMNIKMLCKMSSVATDNKPSRKPKHSKSQKDHIYNKGLPHACEGNKG